MGGGARWSLGIHIFNKAFQILTQQPLLTCSFIFWGFSYAVNHGPKILKGTFQEKAIHKFKLWAVLSSVKKSRETRDVTHAFFQRLHAVGAPRSYWLAGSLVRLIAAVWKRLYSSHPYLVIYFILCNGPKHKRSDAGSSDAPKRRSTVKRRRFSIMQGDNLRLRPPRSTVRMNLLCVTLWRSRKKLVLALPSHPREVRPWSACVVNA